MVQIFDTFYEQYHCEAEYVYCLSTLYTMYRICCYDMAIGEVIKVINTFMMGTTHNCHDDPKTLI